MPAPDFVIYINIPVEVIAEIDKDNEDKHETNLDYLTRVRDVYSYLSEGENWVTIDAMSGDRRKEKRVDEDRRKERRELSDEILRIAKEFLN